MQHGPPRGSAFRYRRVLPTAPPTHSAAGCHWQVIGLAAFLFFQPAAPLVIAAKGPAKFQSALQVANEAAVAAAELRQYRLRKSARHLRRRSAGDGPGDPALERELPYIDHKAESLFFPKQEEVWAKGECYALARRVIKGYKQRGPPGDVAEKREIHTGIYWEDRKATELSLLMEKVELNVMSFLATQDLSRTRLRIWSDVDPADASNPLPKALASILERPDLSSSIAFSRFEAAAEFAKLGIHTGKFIEKLYNTSGCDGQKSDLQRVAILFNHGGLWMDTDMIYIQDLSPLMGEDWAYLGQPGFINGAALSVSEPGSLFINAYLQSILREDVVEMPNSTYLRDDYTHWGATTFERMFNSSLERGTFHVLPTCLLDLAWLKKTPAPSWDKFFKPTSDENRSRQVDYLYPRNQREDGFAYHWHGHWNDPVSLNSVAHALQRIYYCKLKLEKCAH